MVGTSLVLMQFHEKGIRWRTWGNVARSCEMYESWAFSFFFLKKKIKSFPDVNAENTRVAHDDLFANVASNCQTSSTHFLLFVHSGVEGISCLHSHFLSDSLFSLSVWLRFIHFPSQITSSAPSRSQPAAGRWKSEGAESSRSSALSGRCESWHKRTVSIHFLFSPFSLFFFFFLICCCFLPFWSMQWLDRASDERMFNSKSNYVYFTTVGLPMWAKAKKSRSSVYIQPYFVEMYAICHNASKDGVTIPA